MSVSKSNIKKDQNFTSKDVEIQSREFVYEGFFKMEKLSLRHRLFEGGWSSFMSRELFERGHAVAAIMYDPVNKLIGLIEQFRIGAINGVNGPWLCEIVAGMAEEGELPEDVIRRELLEEAEMSPQQLIPICDYYTSPGGTSEVISLYCAVGDLTKVGGIHGLEEENEDIRVMVLPQQEVFNSLYSGRYNNGASLISIQWLMMNHLRLTEARDDKD